MRSLVSDLIPEYNKKFHFFLKKRHTGLCCETPLFLLSHHQPMCVPLPLTSIWESACTLHYGNFNTAQVFFFNQSSPGNGELKKHSM